MTPAERESQAREVAHDIGGICFRPYNPHTHQCNRITAALVAVMEERDAAGCIACNEPRRDEFSAIKGRCKGCGWRVVAKPPRSSAAPETKGGTDDDV